MEEPDWAQVGYPEDRLPGHPLLRRPEEEGRPASRWTRSTPSCCAPTRSSASRSRSRRSWPAWSGAERGRPRRRRAPDRRGRGVRQRVGRHHVPQEPARGGRDLLPDQRGGARPPGAGAPVSRQRGAGRRQLLRRPEQRRVHRRLVRVHPQGRALPDGAVHLLPHQCQEHRAVRAHADHRRGGRQRVLPRRLHRAAARREPAARRRGRAGRDGRRHHQVQHGAELVSRRRERQGRHLQLRHQARRLPRRPQQGQLDAGRDRLGDHLEVSELHPAGRGQRRRVLLGGADQQPPAGRYRHQDDPHRQGHAAPPSSARASAPGGRTTPIAAWCGSCRRPPARGTSPSATAC